MKLSVQICSEEEWPCIKLILQLQGNKLPSCPFGEYIDDRLGSNECIWYHSGATKTRAAGACQYAISAWHPDAIINLGTCGGVAQNVKELDIILADRTIQYDVIQRFGKPSESFQRDKETTIDLSWVEKSRISEMSHVGAIASADQDLSLKCRGKLQEAKILAADWESASIAKVCELNKIKCLILRGVSDIPEETPSSKRSQDYHYRHNMPIIMKRLVDILVQMSPLFDDNNR
jgi:adenosylhomocysteine nucleosidase